jgi:alcohol dehydrogenase
MLGFRLPTHTHVAPGCLERLPEVLRACACHRPLLVLDPGLRATEWPEKIQEMLAATGLELDIFDQVEANPRTTTATRAAERIREQGLDGVLGLGGGSVLDTGKAAAMLATNDGLPEHYEGSNRYANAPLPFIAVPTTCGTGSEVTWVSVLTHEATHSKISVKGETMFPHTALVDADLIRTLPPALVASTGVDALTHALESTTGLLANPASNALAEKAIALLLRFLPRAVADVAGDDPAREAVMRAATLAGISFGNSDVGGVHCLSESIGGLFDCPHGATNALLLAPVMRYHGEFVTQRLASLELLAPDALRDADAAERAASFLERIESLVQVLGIPAWKDLGISSGEYHRIAEAAARNGSNPSNPRPMATQDYLAILESL